MVFARKNYWMEIAAVVLLSLTAGMLYSQTAGDRWTEAQANAWYDRQPWLVGANYIPSDAINEFEMFQAATWNAPLNDKELGLAESIGMNTARVFLQDQLWVSDPKGFQQRLDAFLTIAAKHHIRPILVLFDSCWEPNPHLGPQHPPIPGTHNSGWVQSPGKERLMNRAAEPELKAYVEGVVGAFSNDDRILAWDVWNEPDNQGRDKKADEAAKVERVNQLLPQVFAWARSARPKQPLTSAPWRGDWSNAGNESETVKTQLSNSDVITFHNYGWPEEFEARIAELRSLHRPLLCTEYMARGNGSTFDTILPLAKREHVAAINWGLVAGKTQTYLPWDSWQRPYVNEQPTVWFHEVFKQDDTPYRQREVDLMRELTGRGLPASQQTTAAGASAP
jgi:hypothetical protein